MFRLVLIRCGLTSSGDEGRFLGKRDEPLSPQGKAQIRQWAGEGRYPAAQLVFTSGLLRARQTAGLIYPNTPKVLAGGWEAFDYGAYDGRRYDEIGEDEQFRQWTRAPQLMPCPGGEDPHRFAVRCSVAFQELSREVAGKGLDCAAVVTHRLVIDAVLKRYAIPRSAYRSWDVSWGGGYLLECNSMQDTLKVQNML